MDVEHGMLGGEAYDENGEKLARMMPMPDHHVHARDESYSDHHHGHSPHQQEEGANQAL